MLKHEKVTVLLIFAPKLNTVPSLYKSMACIDPALISTTVAPGAGVVDRNVTCTAVVLNVLPPSPAPMVANVAVDPVIYAL
jgi:hypothetical protein